MKSCLGPLFVLWPFFAMFVVGNWMFLFGLVWVSGLFLGVVGFYYWKERTK